jgi:hypothetical protein
VLLGQSVRRRRIGRHLVGFIGDDDAMAACSSGEMPAGGRRQLGMRESA